MIILMCSESPYLCIFLNYILILCSYYKMTTFKILYSLLNISRGRRPSQTDVFPNHSKLNTSQSVGLLWARDRPVAETCQHTTLIRDRYPCVRWGSNSQSHQTIGRRHSL
jgi:hypothetical protein